MVGFCSVGHKWRTETHLLYENLHCLLKHNWFVLLNCPKKVIWLCIVIHCVYDILCLNALLKTLYYAVNIVFKAWTNLWCYLVSRGQTAFFLLCVFPDQNTEEKKQSGHARLDVTLSMITARTVGEQIASFFELLFYGIRFCSDCPIICSIWIDALVLTLFFVSITVTRTNVDTFDCSIRVYSACI